MFINQFSDKEVQKAILANQWTYGQLFPEVISPGSQPIEHGYKTHTFTSNFSDTVNPWGDASYDLETNALINHPQRKGKLWVYFAPTNDLLSLSAGEYSSITNDLVNKFSIFYSSSNGPIPLSDFKNFDHYELTSNGSSKKNISLLGYKKLRVTSAAICIKQIGPLKDRSGILKIGMSYKGAIENMADINYDHFENYFMTSKIIQLNNNSEIICRYRLPKHMIDTYAPFDPITSIPYFFIYGEGISTNMSLDINITRHFEGIVLPEYSQFHSGSNQPIQTPFNIQNTVVNSIVNDDNTINPINDHPVKNDTAPPNKPTNGTINAMSRGKAGDPLQKMNKQDNVTAYSKAFNYIGRAVSYTAANVYNATRQKVINEARETAIQAIYSMIPNRIRKSRGGQLMKEYAIRKLAEGAGWDDVMFELSSNVLEYLEREANNTVDVLLKKLGGK